MSENLPYGLLQRINFLSTHYYELDKWEVTGLVTLWSDTLAGQCIFLILSSESVSEVEKYFTTRLIGAPEVATTLLSFQIAGGTSFWTPIFLAS